MNNVISYVAEFGKYDFDEKPFNEVDSLVLSQLSYLNYDGFVKNVDEDAGPVSINSIFESDNLDNILRDYWYKKENMELFANVSNSKRFGGMKLNYYENVISQVSESQFAAVTYILPDKSVYIAFRGTDATLVGWKEDMMLAYSEPLQSQYMAAEYLDSVAKKIAGSFRVGGHSKGGNLAVFAAMYCQRSTRNRILDIYDHDGPGFRPEIIKEGHFGAVKNLIHKYIPKSSIVGIILEDNIDYEVVECWSVGALQHNTYTWKSVDGAFVKAEGMTKAKQLKDRALNDWIYSLSDSEVRTFIDALFDVLSSNDAKNVFDLKNDPKSNFLSAVNSYKELDERTKNVIGGIVRRLAAIYSEKAFEEFVNATKALKEEMNKWQEDALSHMNQIKTKMKH